jgi:hypothetical protein
VTGGGSKGTEEAIRGKDSPTTLSRLLDQGVEKGVARANATTVASQAIGLGSVAPQRNHKPYQVPQRSPPRAPPPTLPSLSPTLTKKSFGWSRKWPLVHDLERGLPGDPNADACAHLLGAEPEDLTKAEEDWLYEVEEGGHYCCWGEREYA